MSLSLRPEVHVLCGPIASGKSTYARRAAAKGFVVINDDAIVEAVHGGNYQLYDDKLKPLYKSVENHILQAALMANRPVIVDRGLNCSDHSRQRWVGLAKAFDAVPVAVLFQDEGPEVHAARRHVSDGRGHSYGYWLRVAKAHRDRWVTPTVTEGFAEVRTVAFNDINNLW